MAIFVSTMRPVDRVKFSLPKLSSSTPVKLAVLFEGVEAMEKKKLQELLDEYEKAMITLEQNYLALNRIVEDMQRTYPSSDVTQDERENWFWGFFRLLMILRDSHKEPIEKARETFEQIKTEVFKMTA